MPALASVARERDARPLEIDDAAVEHVDLPLRAHGALGAVRDHDDGRAVGVDAVEEIHDLARHERVEVAGRLVGEDQLRIAGEHARDGHALLLPAGELRRQMLRARGEADQLERALDALLAVRRRRGRDSAAARRRCRRR